jgi:hypothetical protein
MLNLRPADALFSGEQKMQVGQLLSAYGARLNRKDRHCAGPHLQGGTVDSAEVRRQRPCARGKTAEARPAENLLKVRLPCA